MTTQEISRPIRSAATFTHRRQRVSPYVLLSLMLIGWAVAVTCRHVWSGDWALHVATVHQLAQDLASPLDPITGAASKSPYFSPYTVALAALAKLFHCDAATILEIAGLLVLSVLLWAVKDFCLNLSARSSVPVLMVIFTLTLWGWEPFSWSGVISMQSLSYTFAYPSTLATALMLLCWSSLMRSRMVAFGILIALVLLIHPFTAISALIGVAAFAVTNPSRIPRVAAVAILALGLATLWPYSDLRLLVSGASNFSLIHLPLTSDVLGKYGLALVGLPWLILDRNRPGGRMLLGLWAVCALLVGVAAISRQYELARVLPAAVMALHFGLARAIGDPPATRSPLYSAAVPTAVVCCLLAASMVGMGTARMWPPSPAAIPHAIWPLRSPASPYAFAAEHVPPGEQVLSPEPAFGKLALLRHAFPLPAPWPYPYAPGWQERDSAAARFYLSSTTPAARAEIAREFGVRCAATRRPLAVEGFRLVARGSDGRTLLCSELVTM